MAKKEKAKDVLNDIFDKEVTLCYVEFYDLAYSPGWNTKAGYPTKNDALQVGCGILIGEDEDTYTVAMAKGKNVGGDDVLNPLMIFKSLVQEMITFTKEAFSETKKGGRKVKCTKRIMSRQ